MREEVDFQPIRSYNDASSTLVFKNRVDRLLISGGPNHKLRNGSWSGGGGFYRVGKGITSYQGINLNYSRNTYQPNKWVDHEAFMVSAAMPILQVMPTFTSWDSVKSSMVPMYTKGYRLARPGNPIANAGQFLIELRDLPTLPLRMLFRLRSFRALGSEYLNVVFGWKPFVNDLRKMYHAQVSLEKKMKQLIQENGRVIHRKATIKDETVSSQTTTTYKFGLWSLFSVPVQPWGRTHVVDTTTTVTKQWYSASMRYYTPDIGSSMWTKRAKAALFGAQPTPSLLWEVLPWSWLIDWYTNIGDVIDNASVNAVDNLVQLYSYVMSSRVTTRTWSATCQWQAVNSVYYRFPAGSGIASFTSVDESKARVGGLSPYGLDSSLPDLSNYQLAILTALGLSKQRAL